MMPTWQHLPDPLSWCAHGHRYKSQWQWLQRTHWCIFNLCPQGRFTTRLCFAGCSAGLAHAGGTFWECSSSWSLLSHACWGSGYHLAELWPGSGYWGCFLAGLCHNVFFPCMLDPKKHHGLADGASHRITPSWWHAQGKHCLC